MAALTAEEARKTRISTELAAFGTIIGTSITAIAIIVVAPLLLNMYLTYRQERKMNSKGTSSPLVAMNNLYRVLVAIGVIFTVVLIVVYLNSLIWFNIETKQPDIINALLETQKSFITIIGTAFASLVAFYFGTRGTQRENSEKTTTITGRKEAGQKALEIIDVSPIDGSVGVDVDSPVTVKFTAPVRGSTINSNTFSVKDENGNFVQGKIALIDDNKTIRFNPVPPFNRNSRYNVTLTKGILDISSESMAEYKEWRFTTEA
jgi:hypothetical protein